MKYVQTLEFKYILNSENKLKDDEANKPIK